MPTMNSPDSKNRENPRSRQGRATYKICLAAIGVALIAICSIITIPLGNVPVTLQTMAIMIIGGVSGVKIGIIAVAVYVSAGIIGVPIFSGFSSGIGVLVGPTGGYIIGFFAIAITSGIGHNITKNSTKKLSVLLPLMTLGVAIDYVVGIAYYAIIYTDTPLNASYVTTALVVPYIIPEIIKTVSAAMITSRINARLNI